MRMLFELLLLGVLVVAAIGTYKLLFPKREEKKDGRKKTS